MEHRPLGGNTGRLRPQVKNEVRQRLLETGACAVGFAIAEPVEEKEWQQFRRWLDSGYNAGMDYMSNYPEIRRDPRLLLDGARTVISIAFNYHPGEFHPLSHPMIAAYAYGDDYHEALRKRLRRVIKEIRERIGGEWRICIDSAPIREKYWATQAGIGFPGDNGAIIVPGVGSMVFLVEIITTCEFEPDKPCRDKCSHCGACLKICPTGALMEECMIDSRRCLNYLTIEHRGEWTDNISRVAMRTHAGRNTFFGCDRCLRVCPHNNLHNLSEANSTIPEFAPRPEILSLTEVDIAELDSDEINSRLQHSPLRRADREELMRNLFNILNKKIP